MNPAITVTPAAKAKIDAVRVKTGQQDACLRIAIAGRRGAQFIYELDLVAASDAPPADLVVHTADLRVLVDPGSADQLDGAVIDFDSSALGGALRVDNTKEGRRDPTADRDHEVRGARNHPS